MDTFIPEPYASNLPHKTYSVCPECKRPVPATVYEKDGKIWIKKECPEHGVFEEVYYEDAEMYHRFRRFAYTYGRLESHEVDLDGSMCPYNCGLCRRHKSQTLLLNLVVTNRCDLSCFYCFFYAREGNPIYEPPLDKIREMLQVGRNQRPVPAQSLQITGGEPTLRKDLVDIVKMAREMGYTHVQVNTNGITISRDYELIKKLREAGTNTFYLSFDGVSPEVNWKNHWEIPYVFEGVRKVGGPGIVLVPTLIRGWNTGEIGDMINFALNHLDIVRGVNFQPVSLVGRMPKKQRDKQRITIPGAIKLIEEQTNGAIPRDAFYPIPFVVPISELVEAITGKPQVYFSSHFACGAATYVFLKDKKVIPVTEFVDVEGLMEDLRNTAEEIRKGKNKYVRLAKLFLVIRRHIDSERDPVDLKKLLFNAIVRHNYSALGKIHEKSLFIGFMHFMDEYNYDVERVERCVIHYVMPDGRIVPFCTFNVFPEVYRDAVQRRYSYSWEEWLQMNPGYDMSKEKYVRTEEIKKKLESGEPYKRVYGDLVQYFR